MQHSCVSLLGDPQLILSDLTLHQSAFAHRECPSLGHYSQSSTRFGLEVFIADHQVDTTLHLYAGLIPAYNVTTHGGVCYPLLVIIQ